MPTTRTVRIHRFGGPDVLQIDELPLPGLAPDEVLVRVHAAGVNPVDYKIRDGHYPGVKQAQLPVALGRDAAGTVAATGEQVNGLRTGDAVFVFLPPGLGGYTQYLVAKAVELTRSPRSLDHIQAGAVPLAAMTAMQGLMDHGKLQADQHVLIHGGAGGVGHFAIQFAKAKGAHVSTTVSGADIDFVRGLGADEAIDYKSRRFEDVVRDVDLVFDLIAGDTQQRSWQVLKRGGALISTLQKPDERMAAERGVRAAHYMAQPNPHQLSAIAGMIDDGKVKVYVHAVFALDDVQQAHRALEHDHVRGKIVLRAP